MADAKTLEELAFPQYWDSRYSPISEVTYDWFASYNKLQPFLHKYIFSKTGTTLLHLGCGNSALPLNLAADGYKNQICLDFSSTVIKNMAAHHPMIKGIDWLVMDVRNMSFKDGVVDVAIDKGTLDTMISGSLWEPPPEVRKITSEYVTEVFRVLKPGGIFLCITYRQPCFIKPIFAAKAWEVETEVLPNDGTGSFDYFGFRMLKSEGDSLASCPATD